MKPYTCNDPVNHDGELYGVGDSIELDDKDAGPLLAVGAISLDAEALLSAGAKPEPRAGRNVAKLGKAPKDKAPGTGEQSGESGQDGQGNQTADGDTEKTNEEQ
jgi:hypothetical protein